MWSLGNVKQLIGRLEKYAEGRVQIPWTVATGCCRFEVENVASATYDWRRLGIMDVAVTPAEADVLIVAGWINEQRAVELKNIHSQLSGSKSVIAVGACAISGSPFQPGAGKIIAVADILPVDIFVPGCPPRPEALLEGMLALQQIRKPALINKNVLYEALRGPG